MLHLRRLPARILPAAWKQAGLNILNQSITLVKFSAQWCQPCKAFSPIAQKVASELKMALEAVDVEEDPERAANQGISTLPTTLVMLGQTEITRIEGAHPAKSLKKLIMEAMDASNRA